MARGWESKAIESQQEEAARARAPVKRRTDAQRATDAKRRTIALSRARTVADLEHATRPAHREMLARALDALDAQLGKLES